MRLNAQNYKKGLLMDEELMGGVSEDAGIPAKFTAFVVRHATGELLGSRSYLELDQALGAINSVQREWVFEKSGGCGGGGADGGKCGEGLCGQGDCTADSESGCPTGVC